MATLLYTIFGITAGASLHCAVRREISPCTCAPHDMFPNTIQVTCERMESFNQVVDALTDRFIPENTIWLKITHSQLDDLDTKTFAEMNMNVKNLRLNHDNLSSLPVSTFRGLTKTEFLSLSDNNLEEIPRQIFDHMPNIGTLDLARGKIETIFSTDFKALPNLRHLVLASNQITTLEPGAFPHTIVNLHVGKNNLTSLNGTVRDLTDLKLLFVNSNDLTTLEDELPFASPNLMMILAQYNRIEYLPSSFKSLPNLDSVYFYNNELKTLGGNLKHSNKLQRLIAFNNRIDYLAEDEFQDSENIEELQLGYNDIKSLNKSLLPIRQLRVANFSNNLLEEFSLREISGLKKLRVLDLSYNRIENLSGRMENLVEPNSFIFELRLEHNLLTTLDGALMGLNRLRILTLSHNRLQQISPDDLIGLEKLEILDISHNEIRTLEETSKTFLPSLEILNASYNLLTSLERDFHGLPVLCLADLSNNMIKSISPELVAHTRCINHGVPNKLEILLQENPVLCDEHLLDLITVMEVQQARLLGIAHCLVPQQIQIDHPVLLQQIPMLPNSNIPNSVMQPPPSIVQIIVPSPIITAPLPIVTKQEDQQQQQQPQQLPQPQYQQQPLMDLIELTTSSSLLATSTAAATTTTTTIIVPLSVSESIASSTEPITVLPIEQLSTTTPTLITTLTTTPTTIQESNELIMEIVSQNPHVIFQQATITEKTQEVLTVEPEEPPEMLQDQVPAE